MNPAIAGHREIDHTADLGFEVWAPSLAGLYAESLLALAELCYDRGAVRPSQERRLEAFAISHEERMVRWLQETYFWLEADLWLAREARQVDVDGDIVRGTVFGEPYDAERHTLHTEIKAITYHRMKVERDEGLWRTTVIVDV